jgi:arginyl-tRNA synthetase
LDEDLFNDINFEEEDENALVKELSNYKNILLKTSSDYMPHILA